MIYLDNASTTPMNPKALNAMDTVLSDIFGNASNLHQCGRRASDILYKSRKIIAECINASPSNIYFTSGGTESNNWIIYMAKKYGMLTGNKHIITSKIEHHSILNPLEELKHFGFEIDFLDVDKDGMVNPLDVEKHIRKDTCLVTIMYANNEIGSIQNISEIGSICKKHNIAFHTDSVQAIGHIPVDVKKDNINFLSMSAHKFGGAKGIGVLYADCNHLNLSPMILGGKQEKGFRGGTENIAAIYSMAVALKESCNNLKENYIYVENLKDILYNGILSNIEDAELNGCIESRLPGNLNIRFKGINGESLLFMLDNDGICVSTSSACTSGSQTPSHVLTAIGLTETQAFSSIRFSLSEMNTEEEINFVLDSLKKNIEFLRSM